MPSPNVLRAVAMLAPGKRVTVLAAGKSYALPETPAAPVALPTTLEFVSKQLLERDADTRAVAASIAARAEEMLTAVKNAIGLVADGQNKVAQSVEELAATLELPVKPIYDESGKLIGANRVKNLGD